MARRRRLTPVAAHLAGEAEMETAVTRTRAPIAAAAGDAAAGAALAEVAGALEAARAEGRLAQPLPLCAVVDDHLERDRYAATADEISTEPDEEMTSLMESISARGQKEPNEEVARGDGRYGLISGCSRLTHLGSQHAKSGEEQYAAVHAVYSQPDSAAAL